MMERTECASQGKIMPLPVTMHQNLLRCLDTVCSTGVCKAKCWDYGVTSQKEPGSLSCPGKLLNSQPTSNGG